MGGHPEGHPNNSKEELWGWMEKKLAAVRAHGMTPLIVTQFAFDDDAIVEWIGEMRERGIDVPVRLGVPGAGGHQAAARLRQALRRGRLGQRAEEVRHLGHQPHRQGAGPDKLVNSLDEKLTERHGRVRLHFYPFGALKPRRPSGSIPTPPSIERGSKDDGRRGDRARSMGAMTQTSTLSLQCPIRTGVSARVSSFTAERGCIILEAQQFSDRASGRFFMRVVFDPQDNSAETLRAEFAPLARQFEMEWQLRDPDWMPRVVLMVSAFDHCLGDLLYRMRIGEIRMEVVAIISNHPREALTTSLMGDDIPYHYLPVTKGQARREQEAQVRAIVEQTGADLVVLARYMQIFSDDMVRHLRGRCINIHHSFLPGFKGAKPLPPGLPARGQDDRRHQPLRHQRSRRGADHRAGRRGYRPFREPEDLVAKGRDVERRVLARAVNAHLQDRVHQR